MILIAFSLNFRSVGKNWGYFKEQYGMAVSTFKNVVLNKCEPIVVNGRPGWENKKHYDYPPEGMYTWTTG